MLGMDQLARSSSDQVDRARLSTGPIERKHQAYLVGNKIPNENNFLLLNYIYISKHPICGGLREKAVFRFTVLDECLRFAAPTAVKRRQNAALDVFSINCFVYSYTTRFH